MKNSFYPAWCIGAILAVAAPRAAAVTTVVSNDAFDLASAFAPVPGSSNVTGNFVEESGSGQIGTFSDGLATVGFESGIVLSTGNVANIFLGAASPLSTGFGGTPNLATAALLNQIPGSSFDYHDTTRFSMTFDVGLANDYINFSFVYLTSEISPGDKFGVFVDGLYSGDLFGASIDQGHPWLAAAVPSVGFGHALYLDGNTVNPTAFTVSLRAPNPGSSFTVDFVLSDVFNDTVDTAVFLGEFSATKTALGPVLIPEPSSAALAGLAGLALMRRCRRRR